MGMTNTKLRLGFLRKRISRTPAREIQFYSLSFTFSSGLANRYVEFIASLGTFCIHLGKKSQLKDATGIKKFSREVKSCSRHTQAWGGDKENQHP